MIRSSTSINRSRQPSPLAWVACRILAAALLGILTTQASGPAYDQQPYSLDSGLHSNVGEKEILAFSQVVHAAEAKRIRLHFSAYNLGQRSGLMVTCLTDQRHQRLTSASVPQW